MNPLAVGIDYIRQCRALGFSDAEIIQELQKTGWQTGDINAALMQAAVTTKPAKRSNRWLWILLISLCVALVVLAGVGTWLVTSGRLGN